LFLQLVRCVKIGRIFLQNQPLAHLEELSIFITMIQFSSYPITLLIKEYYIEDHYKV
jgi:hypothetical protein